MPLPVVANAYRAFLGFTAGEGGRSWSTHLDYNGTGTGDAADLGDALETALQAFKAITAGTTGEEVQDYFTTSIDFVSLEVYELDGSSVAVPITITSTAWGTNSTTTTALPPDLAVVASLRTGTRGPRGRGRQYWACNSATANAAGLVNAALRASFVKGYEDELLQVTGASDVYNLSVIGRSAVGSSTLVARDVLSVAVDQHFDVQRRRGQG